MAFEEGLNGEKKRAIQKFRKRMENSLTPKLQEDDFLFYRFLKACDFDVDAAEKMLNKHIIWHKAYQVDRILENYKPREVLRKYTAFSSIGYDKEGDRVIYIPAGKFEMRDIFRCIKMSEWIKYLIWLTERQIFLTRENSKKMGKTFTRALFIVNLDQLTFSNMTYSKMIEAFMQSIHFLQDNYPEYMKCVYVINAPVYFPIIFSIGKTIMSSASIKKTQVFSYDGWKDKLLDVIDADVLPAFLGGNKTDPDGNPLCLSFISHSGDIPPAYYLPNEERYFEDLNQVRKVTVPQMAKKEIYVSVIENESMIKWRFLVKNKDIGFGLYFQESEQEFKELLPVLRYSTSDGTEEGSYNCHSTGKYIIIFDNSYSWQNSKEVEYCVTVVKINL